MRPRQVRYQAALRPDFLHSPYSYRSASIGSIREAFIAG